MYIDGICCELCIKNSQFDCPIQTASIWSRWKNFCNEFIDSNGKTIEQIIIRTIGKD